MKLNFKHSQTVPVFLPFIPSTQVKLLFSIMRKTTLTLINKLKKIPNQFNDEFKQLINEIRNIHEDYITLRVFSGVNIDKFNHAIVWFNHIDRSLETWLKGFNHESCIKRVSTLNSLDYSHLLWVIYNSEETKYGQFEDIGFIINNQQLLRNLQRTMKWRMTIDEIKEFLVKEWNCSEEDELNFFMDNADELDDNDYEIGKTNRLNMYVSFLILSEKHLVSFILYTH